MELNVSYEVRNGRQQMWLKTEVRTVGMLLRDRATGEKIVQFVRNALTKQEIYPSTRVLARLSQVADGYKIHLATLPRNTDADWYAPYMTASDYADARTMGDTVNYMLRDLRESMGVAEYRPGDRVQTHPASDAWIRGDRYGTVTKIGRKYVHVGMDRSGRTMRFTPNMLFHVQ